MALNDYAVTITISESPSDKLGIRLIQSHTIITRVSDGAVLWDVTEPNDTPDRAQTTAANMVKSFEQFSRSKAGFQSGLQDLFPAPDIKAPTTLQIFDATFAASNKAQAYIEKGLIPTDDTLILAIAQALEVAKVAASNEAKLDLASTLALIPSAQSDSLGESTIKGI